MLSRVAFQVQERERTKVLQSFTPAPPGRGRMLFLSVFPSDLSNRPGVHEWRTGTMALTGLTKLSAPHRMECANSDSDIWQEDGETTSRKHEDTSGCLFLIACKGARQS